MLETGILLLFLLPGLSAYCAIYGLFHSGKAIAPEPPAANSVETVAIIVAVSIIIHFVSASAFSINRLICVQVCPLTVPSGWFDPYAGALNALGGQGMSGDAMAAALGGVLAQGGIAYAGIRLWLGYLARRDRLPAWVYGWATDLANSLDNVNTVVTAYVLTTIDHGDKAVAYGGLLNDVALKPDGSISRISLYDGERYLVDLGSKLQVASLSDPLSQFTLMVIDASNIRNIAFETIDLGDGDF